MLRVSMMILRATGERQKEREILEVMALLPRLNNFRACCAVQKVKATSFLVCQQSIELEKGRCFSRTFDLKPHTHTK